MKTKLVKSVLTVLVLATSATALADAPPYSVLAQNRTGNGRSMWVTMYNMFDSIRETRCIRDGDEFLFSGYYPPLSYYIRGEIKENVDCGGSTIDDITKGVETTRGSYAKMITYDDGGRDAYMWRTSLGPNAEGPGVQAKSGSKLEAKNGLKNGKSVWVTIYNFFGSIRDTGCVEAGTKLAWDGYYDMGLSYGMRFEVKSGAQCSGDTIYDSTLGISDIHGTKGGLISSIKEDGVEKYLLSHYEE